MRRHLERDGQKEVDGMHVRGNQPPASPQAQPGPFPLADEQRHAHAPTVAETQEHQSQAAWHNLDGLVVQRSDAHHTLIMSGILVRFAPLTYQVILPLLERFNRPVSVDTICREAFGCPYSLSEAKRLYRHIDRARPQLAVFGFRITSLNKRRGYMLWRSDSNLPTMGQESVEAVSR